KMVKILVVEDDAELAPVVRDWLSFEHYTVELVDNGSEAKDRLQLFAYDLVILDWELPDMSGMDILRGFRAGGGMTPVLVLTGKRSIDNKVEGFDSGADDYLTKPFHGKELVARVKALLKRPAIQLPTNLKYGELELDPNNFVVRRNGDEIRLVPKEFALLEFLMRNPKKLFSSE